MKNSTHPKPSKKTIILLCSAVFIIIAIASIVIGINMRKAENTEHEIITKSNLEQIIHVSDLSTLEAVYNGIAKVANAESPEEIDYYVSYNAKVKAGIDFRQVEIEVNAEDKIISVTLPEIKINDVTVSAQAYQKCIEDVANEVNGEKAVYELAQENARNIIETLIKPFICQIDAEYKLEIN